MAAVSTIAATLKPLKTGIKIGIKHGSGEVELIDKGSEQRW
ncbi:hypothetical protein [Leptolyngbya sp. BC1307]|nr:hypothetical protein [Leptolyngbya sp. BC1307]